MNRLGNLVFEYQNAGSPSPPTVQLTEIWLLPPLFHSTNTLLKVNSNCPVADTMVISSKALSCFTCGPLFSDFPDTTLCFGSSSSHSSPAPLPLTIPQCPCFPASAPSAIFPLPHYSPLGELCHGHIFNDHHNTLMTSKLAPSDLCQRSLKIPLDT